MPLFSLIVYLVSFSTNNKRDFIACILTLVPTLIMNTEKNFKQEKMLEFT